MKFFTNLKALKSAAFATLLFFGFFINYESKGQAINLSANNVAFNNANPRTINFGSRTIATTSDTTIIISNTGNNTLSSITASLSNTTDFELVSNPAVSVNAGANTSLIVRARRATVGNNTGNLTISSNDPDRPSIIIPLSSSTIAASSVMTAGVRTDDFISNVGNASNPEFFVFNFNIVDDFNNPSADADFTFLSQVTIRPGVGNTVTDFTSLISLARLYSNSNIVTGTITANSIVFSNLNTNATGFAGFVADNSSRPYHLGIIFRTDLTPAQKAQVDRLRFVFSLNTNDIVMSAPPTSLIRGGSVSSDITSNQINIVADRYNFFTQPVNGEVNVALPTVVVTAEDARGFRDTDVSRSIQISSPNLAQEITASMANGVSNISNIVFPAPATNTNLRVSASTGGLPALNSNTFNVVGIAPVIRLSANNIVINNANPRTINFGSRSLNTTTDSTIVISNTGNSPLTNITATLSNTTDFELVSNPAGSLNAGVNTSFVVRARRVSQGNHTGNLTIASNDPLRPSIIIPLASGIAIPSSVITAGVRTADFISNVGNASNPEFFVFNFNVVDDFNNPSADADFTFLSQVTIRPGVGNTVTDFTSLISLARLYSNSNIVTGTITANSIVFSNMNTNATGFAGFVNDNTSRPYNMAITFRTDLTPAQKAQVDRLRFVFSLNTNDIIMSAPPTSLIAANTVSSDVTSNQINIVADRYNFFTQPVNGEVNVALPTVVVTAEDARGFRDSDVNGSIQITSPNLAQAVNGTITNGTASLSNIVFNAPATNTNLRVSSSTIPFTALNSTSFNVVRFIPNIGLVANNVAINNASPRTINFGRREINITSDTTFVISNSGNGALNGLSATLSNSTDFELVSSPPTSISAGGNASFVVRARRATTGDHSGTLTIASNDPNTPSIVIPLSSSGFFASSFLQTEDRTAEFITNVGTPNLETTVFRFRITDDLNNHPADNQFTFMSQITVRAGAGNTVTDFRSLIASARLISGPEFVFGTINSNSIVFSGMNTEATQFVGFVFDNTFRIYNMRIAFRSDLTPAQKAQVDRLRLVFQLNSEDIQMSATSSEIRQSLAFSDSTVNRINIIADRFNFFTQPVNGFTNEPLPTVVVTAEDTRGFRDLDANQGIQITSPNLAQAINANITNGAASLSNIIFPTAVNNTNLRVAPTTGSFAALNSNTFNIIQTFPIIGLSANNVAFNTSTPRTMNFGSRNLNFTDDSTFIIRNTGNATLTGVTVTLSNTDDFSLLSTPTTTINAGASSSFMVRVRRRTLGNHTGTITIRSNDPNTPTIVITLSSSAYAAFTTIAVTDFTQTEINHMGSTPLVFRVAVVDDNINRDFDNLGTVISQLTFRQGPENTVSNFTSLIAGARLFSSNQWLTGTVNSDNIVFSNMELASTNFFGFVADNTIRFYDLYISFRSDLTPSQKAVVDNLRFVFSLDASDVITVQESSQIFPRTLNSGTTRNRININAAGVNFFTQPSNGVTNVPLPTFIMAAEDENGFRDLDFNRTLFFSSPDLPQAISAPLVNGVAMVSNVVFATPVTNTTLTVFTVTGYIPPVTSNPFNIGLPTPSASFFRYIGPDGGSLNVASNWEASLNGTSGWVVSNIVPTAAALEVKITGNKSAVLSGAFACSKLVIDAGCTLSTNGFVITINNIATAGAVELEVNGVLETNAGATGLSLANGVNANINSGATLRFTNTANNSSLISSITGVTFNLAANSNLEVLGITSETAANIAAVFPTVANLKVQYTGSQTTNFEGANFPNTILGNLEMEAPSNLSREIRLANNTPYTLNIGGNLIVSQGALNGSNHTAGAKTINVSGNVVLGQNARLYFAEASENTLNIRGNLSLNAGASLSATAEQRYSLNFTGSGNSQLSMAANAGEIPSCSIQKSGEGKVLSNGNIRLGVLNFISGNFETRPQDTVILSTSLNNESASSGMVGNVRITQTATQNQLRTFGNLGISINALGANPGQFIVTRSTGNNVVVTHPNNANNKSAKRRYRVEGYNNAGSLNANVVFGYQNEELNGIPADNITMARSTNNGQTWLKIPSNQVTVNAANRTVSLTGINAFSEWTFQNGENGPLPVSLTYFTAKRTKLGNELEWQTSAEVQNVGFNIERSLNGKNFEQVGFVAGAGNSNKMLQYNFTDVFTQDAYYRLAQLDFDGKVNYSPTIFVGEAKESLSLAVYPNPMQERAMLSIQNAQEQEILQMALYNQSGQLIAKTEGKPLELSVWFEAQSRTLKAGLYMLQVQHSQGQQQLKLIKQ